MLLAFLPLLPTIIMKNAFPLFIGKTTLALPVHRAVFLFLAFTILSGTSLPAQKPVNLDSLLAANDRYVHRDTVKLKTLLAISQAYSSVNPQKGLAAAEACISIAEELGIPLYQGRSYFMKGLNLFLLGNYDSTIVLSLRAIAIFERLDRKEDLGKAYSIRGGVAYYRADYPTAELYWEKSIEAYRSINNLPGQARTMANLGLIYLAQQQLQKALDIFLEAASIQEKLEQWANLPNSYAHIASVHLNWQDYNKALLYYQKALDIARKTNNKFLISVYLSNIGSVYFNVGNYPKAIDLYQETIGLNEELGNKESHANNLLTLSMIYSNLKDFPQAIQYIEKATRLSREMGNQNMQGRCLDNLGTQYRRMGDLTKAVSCFTQATAIYEEVNFREGLRDVSLSLGFINLEQKDFAKSISYFQKARMLCDTVADKQLLVTCLNGLAGNCLYAPDSLLMPMLGIQAENRYPEAIRLLLRAQETARSAKVIYDEQVTWKSLSQAYEFSGDYINSYKAFKQYIAIRDSVVGEDTKKQITRKEIQFEFDKKETALKFEQQLTLEQLAQQKLLSIQQEQALNIKQQALTISNKEKDLQRLAYLKEKAEKQEKEQQLSLAEKDKQIQEVQLGSLIQDKALQLQTLAKQNALIGFLLAGLAAILLGFAAFSFWQRQKRAKKEAVAQVQYTRQLLENTEDERGRIARDLHDGISHELLTLKKALHNTEAVQKIDSIINDIRQISRNLHPVMLESIGLKLSLETLCDQYMEQEELFISHDINYTHKLPGTAELQLFRIVQEAITNTIKYAGADACKVTLQDGNNGLQLTIQDNGRGFDVDQALNSGKSFGLRSILQRSKAIGGSADIQSSAIGTVIRVEVPCP